MICVHLRKSAITKKATLTRRLSSSYKPAAGSLLRLRILLQFANGDGLAGIADLETRETANRDVLAQLADLAGNQLMHGDARLLDERLIEQAYLFVELRHLPFHDLLHNRRRLPRRGRLGAVDFLLALMGVRRDVFLADELRIGRRNVHGDILDQVLEVVGAGHEVALAIDFHEHADLPAGMNVAGNRAFAGHARGLLSGGGDALLPQVIDSRFLVAIASLEGLLAIHHRRSGALAQFAHLFRGDVWLLALVLARSCRSSH